MNGPQLENGFTRIANEILERISTVPLNGTQFRILMVIWRYTYGFNRKEHELSQAFIAEASGLSERQVRRELKRLVEMKIINVVKEATFSSARVLAFNKYFDNWQVTNQTTVDEIDPSPEDKLDLSTEDKLDLSSPDRLVLSPGDGLDPQERQYKDNIKDSTKDSTCLSNDKQDANGVPPTPTYSENKLTNQQIITELTDEYRSITDVKPEKSDYAFIGNCYNQYGYAAVLDAIHTLQTRVAAGFQPAKPKIYLLGILKGESSNGYSTDKRNNVLDITAKRDSIRKDALFRRSLR